MMRRPIIGVIGGNIVKCNTIKMAKDVGRAVAIEGAVLLTGGQPEGKEQVKRAALRGAIDAQAAGVAIARFIGVLPKDDPANVEGINPETQWLIDTGLSSGQRNPVNILTSDAIIVLAGDAGTLAELGFALMARKPVFFVGSVEALRAAIVKKDNKLRTALDEGIRKYIEICGGPLTVASIENRLRSLLSADNEIRAIDKYGDDDIHKLVRTAIKGLGDACLCLESGFPDIPGFPKKNKFETWLRQMR